MQKIESEPLYIKVEKEILKLFENKISNNRLQSEEELAEILGVSRYTVRTALNTLWKKGYITKRHGKGNFLHKSAYKAKMRIDLYHNFSELLRTAGYYPSIKKSDFTIVSLKPSIKDKFAIDGEEKLVKFTWLYMADKTPAIFVDIQIPKSLFVKEPEKDHNDSLREFLSEYCQQDLAQCIANIKAVNDDDMCMRFSLEHNKALVMWEEFFYNIFDQMICYNQIYFNPDVMDLSLLIKI